MGDHGGIAVRADIPVAVSRVELRCSVQRIRDREAVRHSMAVEAVGRRRPEGPRQLTQANLELVRRLKDPAGFHTVMNELRETSRFPNRFDPNAHVGRALGVMATRHQDRQRSRGAAILDHLSTANRRVVARLQDPTAFLVALADIRDSRPGRTFDPNDHMAAGLQRLAETVAGRAAPSRPRGPSLPGE